MKNISDILSPGSLAQPVILLGLSLLVANAGSYNRMDRSVGTRAGALIPANSIVFARRAFDT